MLTVVAAVAPQRRLQEGDEHQDDDGDEGQRDEDVLVDEEQAHFPHALARGLVNGTALQRKRAPWLCCRSMRGNVLVIAVGDLESLSSGSTAVLRTAVPWTLQASRTLIRN